MLKPIFLQIGATRDGLNPYASVANHANYYTVLVETTEFVDFQSTTINYNFDYILRVEDPSNPREVIAAYQAIGVSKAPTIVLAGFEIYNRSAHKIISLLHKDSSDKFIPLNKVEQRRLFASGQHAQPWFYFYSCLDEVPKSLPTAFYPCVLKPVDSGGGLGIWLTFSDRELQAAIDELKKTNNYSSLNFTGFLIEQYLEGEEFSLQGVVSNEIPHALGCCRKIIEREPIIGGPQGFRESGHVAFSPKSFSDSFILFMEFCCSQFGYNNGAFHIDFIVVDEIIYFIEMGFRMSGMGISSIVDYVSGKSWAEISFKISEGKAIEIVPCDSGRRALGQLRIRKLQQLRAAEELIRQGLTATITYTNYDAGKAISISPNLEADVSRHSGIMATMEIRGQDHRGIIDNFNLIVSASNPIG